MIRSLPGDTDAGERAEKQHHRGTHRIAKPAETLERVLRYAPIMGITRLANVTHLDVIGIPVVVATRPNARSLSVSQGKGLDLLSAKVWALRESVEAYHAEGIPLALKLGSSNELRFTNRLVDPWLLPRHGLASFHNAARLLWIEGQDLVEGDALWVPFELVHLNYTLPSLPEAGYFLATSNGLASGNHLLEAISHGLSEVVERDATTLWNLLPSSERHERKVALGSIHDDECRQVLDQFSAAGVAVGVWETTSDVGVPAFLCTIVDRSPHRLRPVAGAPGMGCHPVREIALLRALTEAAQSRLTAIAGSRDDVRETIHRKELAPGEVERAVREVCEIEGRRDFAAAPSHSAATMEEDVAWLMRKVQGAGFEQGIVVDITRPEFGIPVVRILVPGLEALASISGYTPGPRARRFASNHQ